VSEQVTNVLILCTGNSARSILGEAILAEKGAGRIHAYSAGSKPKGVPHPGALRLLAKKGIDTSPFRSKSWDEFTGPDAPRIDLAITVCGNAAGETCPLFLGARLKAHWGLADPADFTGDDAAVDSAFETMERDAFKAALAKIGEMEGAA
jgi:arsenate reductase (thioredoxin)